MCLRRFLGVDGVCAYGRRRHAPPPRFVSLPYSASFLSESILDRRTW